MTAAASARAADGDAGRRSKGEQTRELILATALRLFREQGYEATTMRAIAQHAGVSVGNAYYYFASKEHLIQGFYEEHIAQHQNLAQPLLREERDLGARLRIVVRTYLEHIRPYHRFAGGFFQHAAAPASPLSPFSAQSEKARRAEIEFLAEVVNGSDARIPKQLRADLPELLWLYLLSVVLHWVHDTSAEQVRTFELADRTCALIVRLIGLARLPGTRGVVEDILDLLHMLRPHSWAGDAPAVTAQPGTSRTASPARP